VNKNYLIFGGSAGIGKSCAKKILEDGNNVYIFSREKKKIIKLKKEFKKFKDKFFFCSGNIGEKKDIEKFIKLAKKQFKEIHGIIFSSGGPEIGNFDSINDKIWVKNFNIHCLGFLNIIKGIVPIFKRNKFGRIVVISSMSAKQPIPGLDISNFLRPGLAGLCKSISMQLIKFNITINTISPGSVLTERSKKIIKSRANKDKITFSKSYNASLKKIPIGRFANPDEIAELAKFLCSEKSSYLTGGIYMVDGGKYLSI
jgi:3-oxoacyl-[acyl-carrier protein] reductase